MIMVCHSSVFHALCSEKYYSFKLIYVHKLNEDISDRQMEFCEFVAQEYANDKH